MPVCLELAKTVILPTTEDREVCSEVDDKIPGVIPVYKLAFCIYRVVATNNIYRYPVCCLHPTVRDRKGVRDICCSRFKLCKK